MTLENDFIMERFHDHYHSKHMLKTLKNPESFADLVNQRGFQSFLQIFIKLYIYNVSLHSKFLVCAYNDNLSYSRYIGSFVDFSWNYEHWFNCWFFMALWKRMFYNVSIFIQCFNYWEFFHGPHKSFLLKK